jgi:anti-sigma regulatory factor (Ser/Thr protein kinase)
MSDPLLKNVFPVAQGDFATAGEVSAAIKNTLKQLGIAPGVVRRIAIAAYEVELNLVIHSMGGELTLAVSPESITLVAKDIGPGIPDIGLAMSEGFSTAPDSVRDLGFGAGMGLPNMKRNADDFRIASEVGVGTEIWMKFTIAP